MGQIKVILEGDDVGEAKVSFWHVQEGDIVEEGQELVELTTAKSILVVSALLQRYNYMWNFINQKNVKLSSLKAKTKQHP